MKKSTKPKEILKTKLKIALVKYNDEVADKIINDLAEQQALLSKQQTGENPKK